MWLFIRIPQNWVPFFNSMQFSADNFEWAKNFLSSRAVSFLENDTGTVSLTIPSYCPYISLSEETPIAVSDSNNSEDWKGKANTQGLSPSTRMDANKRRKNSLRQTPIVETHVCRSEWVRQINNGFKIARCTVKKCTTCTPQTLSTKVIRNLGVQFCSLHGEDLTDDCLLKGSEVKEPVGRKQAGPKTSKGNSKEANDEPGPEGNDAAWFHQSAR